jgi:hypothetical protein
VKYLTLITVPPTPTTLFPNYYQGILRQVSEIEEDFVRFGNKSELSPEIRLKAFATTIT